MKIHTEWMWGSTRWPHAAQYSPATLASQFAHRTSTAFAGGSTGSPELCVSVTVTSCADVEIKRSRQAT
jgi:hypothetical protein